MSSLFRPVLRGGVMFLSQAGASSRLPARRESGRRWYVAVGRRLCLVGSQMLGAVAVHRRAQHEVRAVPAARRQPLLQLFASIGEILGSLWCDSG